MPALPTSATGYGLRPTPTTQESVDSLNFEMTESGRRKSKNGESSRGLNLGRKVLIWQTPVADDSCNRANGKWNSRGEPKLSAQVLMNLPTPRCTDWKNGKQRADFGMNLPTFAKLWPTPLATDGSKGGPNQKGSKGDLRLSSAVHHWPTPCATDHKGTGKTGTLRDRLDYAVERGATKSNTYATPQARDYRTGQQERYENPDRTKNLNDQVGGQLNPTWVEWLMGWPLGWTDLKPLETGRFRLWQESHSMPCAAMKNRSS